MKCLTRGRGESEWESEETIRRGEGEGVWCVLERTEESQGSEERSGEGAMSGIKIRFSWKGVSQGLADQRKRNEL